MVTRCLPCKRLRRHTRWNRLSLDVARSKFPHVCPLRDGVVVDCGAAPLTDAQLARLTDRPRDPRIARMSTPSHGVDWYRAVVGPAGIAQVSAPVCSQPPSPETRR